MKELIDMLNAIPKATDHRDFGLLEYVSRTKPLREKLVESFIEAGGSVCVSQSGKVEASILHHCAVSDSEYLAVQICIRDAEAEAKDAE